ncbi:MAG: type II secretion system F family protein [Armatimonadetes bacterium]|nr:type II secretion system F family protein [Armatimonadota bacterium]
MKLDSGFIFVLLMTLGIVVVVYVGYVIVDAVWLQRSRIRRRVDALAGAGASRTASPQPAQPELSLSEEESLPLIARILSSRGFADRLFLMLLRAGVRLRPSEFIGIVSGLCLLLMMIVALILPTGSLLVRLLRELLALIIGIAVPFSYIKALQARRLAKFNLQLPDALSLIGSAIRSGYSFPRAMQMVADEMPAPISEEFQRVINESNVGLSMDHSFQRMVSRVGSYDLELVVTAVVIQQQIGGNLAEIIDNIGETIRDRVRVQGEMNALTADGKLSGIVLIMLPLFLAGAILILNPGYLKPLIAEPQGVMMVIVGVCLQIVGAIVIKKMLVLDY